MKNEVFQINTDKKTGGISEIVLADNSDSMNWAENSESLWGVPYAVNHASFKDEVLLTLVSSDDIEKGYRAVFSNGAVEVTKTVDLSSADSVKETFVFKNITNLPYFTSQGQLGIFVTPNENYEAANVCMTKKCHTHIWCGESFSYICMLKMGNSDKNLGLYLTKGEIASYSQFNPPYAKNDRGYFRLNLPALSLEAGEEYTVSWTLFEHKGKTDFKKKISTFDNYIGINSEHYTVFQDERIVFTVTFNTLPSNLKIECNGQNVEYSLSERTASVFYLPKNTGEHKFIIEADGRKTHASFYVSLPLGELCRRRAVFIAEKQQYHREGSPLDGAYLIYDNKYKTLYFNNSVSDHNASRERLGMGIFMARYLTVCYDKALHESLDEYKEFVFREFFNPKTGAVYDTIGRDESQIRLYNAPWMCMFLCELYRLEKDNLYLQMMLRTMYDYYNKGGESFYPNAILISEPVRLLRDAGMNEEADELTEKFRLHTAKMIENGTNYPPHEVDYEQTIVAPAATFMLEMYAISGQKDYIEQARKHMLLLERFNGDQPDYRLHNISIRHWDDYWFGKSRQFGDTFPHYWSCLSGYAEVLLSVDENNKNSNTAGEDCIRNNLCLFGDDGSASCAYIYPQSINDNQTECYDEWANDQDFALYFALKYFTEKDN